MTAGDGKTFMGCMSGTSADGVDVATVQTDGREIRSIGPSGYLPYGAGEVARIRAAFGSWPGEARAEAAASTVERAHAAILDTFEPGIPVGFHGQTLAHDPDNGRTHQAGDGQKLADATGRPVIWDFRSNDMRHGGQGAPLAPFYHFALAGWLNLTQPIAFLNLGGVGNVTIVNPTADAPEDEGALLAFDTGPANAVIDDLVRSRTGESHDASGMLAMNGNPDLQIVGEFLDDPWFRPPPRSLDRNDFDWLGSRVEAMSVEDAAATLTACVTGAVRGAFDHVGAAVEMIVVCGGGRKNAAIMAGLSDLLTATVVGVDELGLDGDMLEAQAFAYLAARVMHGLPTSCPGTTGCTSPVVGGRISRPGGLVASGA